MGTAVSAARQRLVLLVDDRLESRELIADELEDLGLNVVQAVDGDDGWERLAQFSFDLVITDLRMPRSDGLYLLRRIRSPQSPKPRVPVVILSAFGTLPVATEAVNAGANAFYSYDDAGIDELKRKVAEILVKRQSDVPSELLGESTASREQRDLLAAHARLHTPVILCGEVGSGHGAAARFIHDLSSAASTPFLTVTQGGANPVDQQDACTVYLHHFASFSEVEQRSWFDRILNIEAEALDALRKHNWYENVTELEHVLESIIALAEDRKITSEKVEAVLARVEGPLTRIAAEEAKKERVLLVKLWAQHLSYTGVANELGVTRNTAKNRMAKYNLVPGRGSLPGLTQPA